MQQRLKGGRRQGADTLRRGRAAHIARTIMHRAVRFSQAIDRRRAVRQGHKAFDGRGRGRRDLEPQPGHREREQEENAADDRHAEP